MAVIDVLDSTGNKISQAELNEEIFNVPVNKNVLHQVVTAQLASKRAGTASVKRRSDVTGSGKKLYRQKGTGRARKGDIKSPVLRGGGVIFGPSPRSYDKKVPKKVRKLALKMALSNKLQDEEIIVVDKFDLDEIKTKRFAGIINALNVKKALIVTDEKNEYVEMSSRNIPGIKVLRSKGLNVLDILKYNKLVILEPSIKGIEGRLLQ